jgi:hypothetical protein
LATWFLVHVLLAFFRSTITADLDLLTRELVVICQLLAREDLPKSKYDDVLFAEDVTDLAVAIRLK